MNPWEQTALLENRRQFFGRASAGIGSLALASLTNPQLFGRTSTGSVNELGLPHFAPKAKRVIYLLQSGAPSQMELWDYKPALNVISFW